MPEVFKKTLGLVQTKFSWAGLEFLEQSEEAIQEAAEGSVHKMFRDAQRDVAVAAKGGGTLKASLKKVVSKYKNGGAAVTAGDKKAFYAHMVEFGTVKMPAQPFLRPALYSNRLFVERLAKGKIKKATEKKYL